MRRSSVVGAVLGPAVLAAAVATGPAAAGNAGAADTDVRAAMDMFLDLGPVGGEDGPVWTPPSWG